MITCMGKDKNPIIIILCARASQAVPRLPAGNAGVSPNAAYYLHGGPSQRDGMTIARHEVPGIGRSAGMSPVRDD